MIYFHIASRAAAAAAAAAAIAATANDNNGSNSSNNSAGKSDSTFPHFSAFRPVCSKIDDFFPPPSAIPHPNPHPLAPLINPSVIETGCAEVSTTVDVNEKEAENGNFY